MGCGTGRHATARLIALGLEVTGVDLSPRSVAAARDEVPGARFIVGDMATVELPPESFDLVTAFYSLIHLPRAEHVAVLRRIARWLRPGGMAVITMAGSDQPTTDVDRAWLGLAPMYWSNWDAATNRQLVADAGLEVLEAQLEPEEEDGRTVSFLWLVACRPPYG